MISLETRRRDVAWRGERRTAHIPLTRSRLLEQLLHLERNKRRREEERRKDKSWAIPEVDTQLVARSASHFELHRPLPFFFLTTSFAFSLFLPPPPLSPLACFFPYLTSFLRSRLSLSFAIRQSSCQIKFLCERSPRTRGVHVTAETIRRWMLRIFQNRKDKRNVFLLPSPLSRCYF